MKRFQLYFSLLLFVLILASCNKTNQSALSQGYHDLTAHYNSNFNANDKMRMVLVNLEKNPGDNYDSILNLYSYENKQSAAAFGGDYDAIIKKCTFSIQQHEMSKWSDDNFFLMGISHYLKGDYMKAIDHFQYITSEYKTGYKNQYVQKKKSSSKKKKKSSSSSKKKSKKKGKNDKPDPDANRVHESKTKHNPKRNPALVWLARSFMKNGQMDEATSVLTFTESDPKFPVNYDIDLRMAKSEAFIMQGNYSKAIDPLKKALDKIKGKKKRARPLFVLGQLNDRQGNYKDAVEAFSKVLKSNPDFNMEFNAKLNIAKISAISGDGGKQAKDILTKMSRDGKNSDMLDQIYYQLGRVYQNENLMADAIKYYQKSLSKNKSNVKQKALTYLALADIYYGDEDFVSSKCFYDSTLTAITSAYGGYSQIKDRSNKLNRLVDKLTIIQSEDSLQQIASLSDADRKKRVETIINNEVKQKEKEEKQKLQGTTVGKASEPADDLGNSGFYFYNANARSRGFSSFKKTWGDRKLEDNWRRSDKTAVAADLSNGTNNPDESKSDGGSDNFPYKEELKRITALLPITADQKKASDDKIIEAYYLLGNIYKEDFDNKPKSITAFEELNRRFPQNKYLAESYYTLYLLNSSLGNSEKAESYKQLILSKYSGSKFAKAINDPGFKSTGKTPEEELIDFYSASYELFNKGQYDEVLKRNTDVQTRAKGSKIEPQLAYLGAMSLGFLKRYDDYRDALSKIITDFPTNPVTEKAKLMLVYLSDKDKYRREDSLASTNKVNKVQDVKKDTVIAEVKKDKELITEKKDISKKEELKENKKKNKKDKGAIAADTTIAVKDTLVQVKIDSSKLVKPEDVIPAGMDLSKFSKEEKVPHRILIMPKDVNIANAELIGKIKEFDNKTPVYKRLQVTPLSISAERKLLVVKEFTDEASAMAYYDAFLKNDELWKGMIKSEIKIFVVTAKNQSVAVGENMLDNAYYFFRKNYLSK